MRRIQKIFASEKEHPYKKGFSFGLEEIPEGHGNLIIEDIIGHADRAMYRQKREHTRAQKNSLT